MKFIPNRNFDREAANTPEMRRFLEKVAVEAAKEVERLAPKMVKHRGSKIEGRLAERNGYAIGQVRVKSSFWHWFEYGSSKIAPRPYIRPGVQAAISRYGGRFGSSTGDIE